VPRVLCAVEGEAAQCSGRGQAESERDSACLLCLQYLGAQRLVLRDEQGLRWLQRVRIRIPGNHISILAVSMTARRRQPNKAPHARAAWRAALSSIVATFIRSDRERLLNRLHLVPFETDQPLTGPASRDAKVA
jgi:hypothetical protein